MSKFTAAELVEFYQKVADGGEIEVNDRDSTWKEAFGNDSPCLFSDTLTWRIKPAKKIIDLQPLIASGIDCEFSNFVGSAEQIGPLLCIDDGGDFNYEGRVLYFQKCRPRMNHKMFHDGGACPIPEGFMVEVYYRSGGALSGNVTDFHWLYSKTSGCVADIIGYEILRLADGWAYPWEAEL